MSLPSYDDLPVRQGAPAGSSWGLWGDDDVLGCLNLLGEDQLRRGLAAARRGVGFRLDLPLDEPAPPLFGRAEHSHDVTWLAGRVGHDETISVWNTQRSSQWDGFRHIRWPPGGFYNGLPDERHGIDHWAQHGIVGRAVVVDIERHLGAQGRQLRHDAPDMIDAHDLAGAIEASGTAVEVGDVLLIRTGWLRWYRGLDEADRVRVANAGTFSGLRPGREMAALLWDLHIAAVAADNPALEAFPPGCAVPNEDHAALVRDPLRASEVFLHYALLALLGLPIGELWDLDALADDCAATSTWDCLLVSNPLRMPSGVASPPNAVAIR